jgi:hypothetical protein
MRESRVRTRFNIGDSVARLAKGGLELAEHGRLAASRHSDHDADALAIDEEAQSFEGPCLDGHVVDLVGVLILGEGQAA